MLATKEPTRVQKYANIIIEEYMIQNDHPLSDLWMPH